jgi:hypothetical protein
LSIKRSYRVLIALLFLTLCALFDRSAWAANPSDEGCNADDECRGHFQRGKTLYKQQDYAGALRSFQTAYDRRQTPILLANIGRTLQKLGRPKEALEYYERCQAAAKTDAELQEKLSQYIAETKALLGDAPPEKPVVEKEPEPAPLTQPLGPVEKPKPLHKRPWFIATMVVGSVVVAGAIATGVIFATRPSPMPDPALDPDVTIVRPMF